MVFGEPLPQKCVDLLPTRFAYSGFPVACDHAPHASSSRYIKLDATALRQFSHERERDSIVCTVYLDWRRRRASQTGERLQNG